MFKGLIDWYMATLKTGGYPLIALLMAIESSIVPLPSEVIIPPAAYLAHSQGQGELPVELGRFGPQQRRCHRRYRDGRPPRG